jgi:hypothetical protein
VILGGELPPLLDHCIPVQQLVVNCLGVLYIFYMCFFLFCIKSVIVS